MMFKLILSTLGLCVIAQLVGCSGTQSFGSAARAGDTVAVAVGWRQNLSRDNITVTFIPGSTGNPAPIAVYGPNHPSIRAIINLYPDPVSSLVVSPQVDEDLTPSARLYADIIDTNYTYDDKDWSQTVVYVDLPSDMPVGMNRIQVTGGGYADPPVSRVEILPGAGSPIAFSTEGASLNAAQLQSMERVDNWAVNFSGSTIPHAIQIDLVHDADRDNGGAGKFHVVNSRGDLKGMTWHDDGLNARVVLTAAQAAGLTDIQDFKFYIAGGITGVAVNSVQAYDNNGNPISGVSAVLMASP